MVRHNRGTEGLIVQLQVDGSQLAHFCRHNRIRRLSFFGSVLREDFGPDSDVDVLVEFEPGAKVGLIRIAALESELSQVAGRKVDMRTPADLSRYFRDEVVAGAKVQYAA
jgi:predicted nucleotidyltransferase